MHPTNESPRQSPGRPAPARPFPESTYRLQFHAGFTFRQATEVVPYLADLGVTHCYASPYLKARPGSTHGYDVIDHCSLNPEVGTEREYEAWVEAMRRYGMSHILDIVPNHVGVATNDNKWWNDVLEHGPASRFGNYFDIAWRGSPRPELHDKVLLPVLGGHYGEVLEKGELRLVYEGGKPAVAYYDRRFPVSPKTYDLIFGPGGKPSAGRVEAMNGKPGDPRSFDRLDDLLSAQNYRLAYWRTASDEINYRRFFDINDLAALSMERQEVFDDTHAFIFRLVAEGKVAGLRIDHPDGLYDPKQYFDRLQRRAAELNSQPLYVVAEKILAPDEPLPAEWACHGTSGYDFLVQLNGLFIDRANEAAFTRLYHDWTGDDTPFEELVYRKKLLILDISLASELQMLAHRLDRIAQKDRHTRDFTHNGLRHALREVIACFPVYRSYVSETGIHETDRLHMDTAIRHAIERNPKTDPSVFHFVRDAVLQKYPDTFEDEDKAEQLQFAGKFQQLTAPTTAKGIEDTAFYIYNRLISLNEVGGEPSHFGVPPEQLHRYFADRQRHWPYALSALSTHDTKRSEDVRARINVLSEIPDEWRQCVERWGRLNEPHKQDVAGLAAPDRNEEYLLYQTLVGAWPLGEPAGDEYATFVKRVQAYMEKALREAKVHTSWTNPNADYDAAVAGFVARILDERVSGEFLRDFRAFQRRVSHYGLLHSLSQTLLHLTAPGVPDTYQGQEVWDFSLVDPDNRRPVDYGLRRQMLDGLKRQFDVAGPDHPTFITDLLGALSDGRAKLLVTWQALLTRRNHPGLFTTGDYLPLDATGPRRDHLFAFARRHGERRAVVAVPRLLTRLMPDGQLPAGPEVWRDTQLVMPATDRETTFRNVFTGERMTVSPSGGSLTVGELLARFPVTLLLSE